MKNILFAMFLLSGVCFADSRQITVGTTGDYPPLTYREGDHFAGRDIQIIQDFAEANHLKLTWVATSWPQLNHDLTSGKFDLAVGGISSNPERANLFLLSAPVGATAKAALIRCRDQARFTSLAAIDQESVIVVENRGGTNQDFALKNIHRATLWLLPQNYTALAKLTDPKQPADVMFTDDVEIAYRHQLNPQLCQAKLQEQFPVTNKVFLFGKNQPGQALQLLFNQWWQQNSTHYLTN